MGHCGVGGLSRSPADNTNVPLEDDQSTEPWRGGSEMQPQLRIPQCEVSGKGQFTEIERWLVVAWRMAGGEWDLPMGRGSLAGWRCGEGCRRLAVTETKITKLKEIVCQGVFFLLKCVP